MGKRFTDTEKWKKQWFGDLTPKNKLLWIYLCDTCSGAGIADFSERFFSFAVGFKVTRDMLTKAFKDKICWIEQNKFFIPSFIEFQYGQLNEACKPHKPHIQELLKLGLLTMENGKGIVTLPKGYRYPTDTLSIPFQKGINTLEEKEKEKEKEQEITKGGAGERELFDTPSAFDLFWAAYPKYRAGSKDKARLAFDKALQRGGITAEQLVKKAKEYAQSEEANKDGGMFAKGAAAWLNDDRFLQAYKPAKSSERNIEQERAEGEEEIRRIFGD